MSAWLEELLACLAASPPLQALAAALGTLVLEDPTTLGSGLLVADGRMAFVTALLGLSAGIALGDLGLFGIGRALGPRLSGRGPLTPGRLARAGRWFERNLVTAVVLSRFVPGMRLPTYVAAGVAGAPLWRFAAVAAAASVVWTALLLTATVQFGRAVMPLLGELRWPAAGLAVLGVVGAQRVAARRLDDADRRASEGPVVSLFELWPPWLFYAPVAAWWLWLAVRHRGLTVPTAANPSIYSGGFVGESKSAILDLVGDPHRRWVAPYVVVAAPGPGGDVEAACRHALRALGDTGIGLPVVAKPDVGQRGAGVQPVRDLSELAGYLRGFPAGGRVVLQRLVGGPTPAGCDGRDLRDAREAGVLWFLAPGRDRGEVFSLTLKLFPELVGDGARTVSELIADDPRARRLASVYRRRHRGQLGRVPAAGERVPLVFAGNHCQGAVFRDGNHLVTAALADRIEEIARSMPGFRFGRFDVRFSDLDRFLAGEDLQIVEVNGASAEATHIWDASAGPLDAYRTLLRQVGVLFEIGADSRRHGHAPVALGRVLGDYWRYRRLARSYPSAR